MKIIFGVAVWLVVYAVGALIVFAPMNFTGTCVAPCRWVIVSPDVRLPVALVGAAGGIVVGFGLARRYR